jgi:uncharacterized protein
MSKEFVARKLDIKAFAEEGAHLQGEQRLREHVRLLAETQGRGAELPVAWTVRGEIRNPLHVQPEIWLHLQAVATLPLTCQRCLASVDMPVSVDRSFRFVSDEEVAAAQDEESEEDVLALSRNFDLVELVEDEMLMEMPLAPRHETCPVPVKLAAEDPDFVSASAQRENPFAVLGKLKSGKS